jgi:hypothetical protein
VAVGALNGRVETLTERADGLNVKVGALDVKTDANRQAINALGEKLAGFQADTHERFDAIDGRFEAVDGRFDAFEQNMNARFRSVDEGQAELKDLIIDRLGGSGQ